MNDTDKPYYISYSPKHLRALQHMDLQEEDLIEIKGFGYDDPKVAIEASLEKSTKSWTILKGHRPVGVFGVRDIDGKGTGQVWLLCTSEAYKPYRHFHEQSKIVVESLLDDYLMLVNLVWEGHSRALRWLKHLGFTQLNRAFHTATHDLHFHQVYKVKIGQ